MLLKEKWIATKTAEIPKRRLITNNQRNQPDAHSPNISKHAFTCIAVRSPAEKNIDKYQNFTVVPDY